MENIGIFFFTDVNRNLSEKFIINIPEIGNFAYWYIETIVIV